MPRKHVTKDLNLDDWVSFTTADAKPHRGRITAKNKRVIRIVDSQGRQYSTSPTGRGTKIRFHSIRAIEMGVFLLDTQLDRSWYSERRGAVFWKEYCQHARWSFAFERVHSVADLQYVLGRAIQEPILIFNGHGDRRHGWKMSNGEVLNQRTRLKIAPKNHHKTIIFSSCDIGANATMCQHLRVQFHAESIIGYTTGIEDEYCFLAEPALLQLIRDGKKPWDATETVRSALDPWKGLNKRSAKVFPIECHHRVS